MINKELILSLKHFKPDLEQTREFNFEVSRHDILSLKEKQPYFIEERLQISPMKKPQTYQDILQEQIDIFEKKDLHSKFISFDQSGETYSIYEDLKILSLLNEPGIDRNASFRILSEQKIIFRSFESIKTRFNHYLKFLQDKDFDLIIDYIKINGCQGYLIFNKDLNDSEFALKEIFQTDPRKNQQQAKENQGQIKTTPLKINLESKLKFESNKKSTLKQSNKKRNKENLLIKQFQDEQNDQIQDLVNKKQKFEEKYNSLSQSQKQDFKELNFVLDTLSIITNLNHLKLANLLDQVSGDLNNLDEVLNDPIKNKHNLWDSCEDEILLNGEQTAQNSPELLLLNQIKEKKFIDQRKIYLTKQINSLQK